MIPCGEDTAKNTGWYLSEYTGECILAWDLARHSYNTHLSQLSSPTLDSSVAFDGCSWSCQSVLMFSMALSLALHSSSSKNPLYALLHFITTAVWALLLTLNLHPWHPHQTLGLLAQLSAGPFCWSSHVSSWTWSVSTYWTEWRCRWQKVGVGKVKG